MTVLSHADVLNTVVNTDGYLIFFAEYDLVGDIVPMRCGKAHLVTHFLPVHIKSGLDVRTFEEQSHTALFPLLGNGDCFPIPCIPHVMTFRRQEERKLHLSFYPVFFHIRVEIE